MPVCLPTDRNWVQVYVKSLDSLTDDRRVLRNLRGYVTETEIVQPIKS